MEGLRRAGMDKVHVVERLVDREACDLVEVNHLEDAVDHIGGVEGAPHRGRGIRDVGQGRLGCCAEIPRQGGQLAGKEPLNNGREMVAEEYLPREAAIGKSDVMEVVRHAGEEGRGRVGGVTWGKDIAENGYDHAVIAMVLGWFKHDPRLARTRGASAGLPDESLRKCRNRAGGKVL